MHPYVAVLSRFVSLQVLPVTIEEEGKRLHPLWLDAQPGPGNAVKFRKPGWTVRKELN